MKLKIQVINKLKFLIDIMRNHLILFIVFITFCCQKKQPEKHILTQRENEIEKIVECVIYQDSLRILKNDSFSIPLCLDLKKIKVYKTNENLKKMPPTPMNGVYLKNLFYTYYELKPFFNKSDSLNLLSQNDILNNFVVDNKNFKKYKTITLDELKEKHKIKNEINYFYLTIPIFSSDNNKAYVEVVERCGGECGGAEALYLEKINNKWKITFRRQLWVS